MFEIVGGSQPPKSEFSDIQEKNFVRLYQIRDYGDKPVPIYVDKNKVSKFSQKGDIILARYGGSLGKVFWAEEGAYNVALAKVCKKYKSKNIIFDEFLFTYYSSSIYQLFVKSASRSAQAGFNKEDLNSLFFPLPPYHEQKKIVEKIKNFTLYIEKYDNMYNRLEKLNNSYKEDLKKSILQYAIQGKLVKQNSNDEPTDVLINKILNEKRELIKTKQIKKENLSIIYKDNTDNQFYEKFDDGKIVNITNEISFDIPQNWCWIRFKNICKVITCGYASTPKYEANGVPFISAKNIKPYKFMPDNHKFINEELYKKLTANFKPEINDILLTRVGAGIGEAAIIDQDFNFAIYVSLTLIKLVNYELIYNKYILNYILSPFGISTSLNNIYGKGASQGNLNVKNVRDFLIPIPPLNEQKKIVNKLEKLFEIL